MLRDDPEGRLFPRFKKSGIGAVERIKIDYKTGGPIKCQSPPGYLLYYIARKNAFEK